MGGAPPPKQLPDLQQPLPVPPKQCSSPLAAPPNSPKTIPQPSSSRPSPPKTPPSPPAVPPAYLLMGQVLGAGEAGPLGQGPPSPPSPKSFLEPSGVQGSWGGSLGSGRADLAQGLQGPESSTEPLPPHIFLGREERGCQTHRDPQNRPTDVPPYCWGRVVRSTGPPSPKNSPINIPTAPL